MFVQTKSALATAAFLLSFVLSAGCESSKNFSSEVACTNYCAKDFDCKNVEPTTTESDECVASCRNTIEDECGNDNQADANAKIEECVDKSCDEFQACLVLEAAPECLAFIN